MILLHVCVRKRYRFEKTCPIQICQISLTILRMLQFDYFTVTGLIDLVIDVVNRDQVARKENRQNLNRLHTKEKW